MKLARASLYSLVALSVSLCACDKGETKDKDTSASAPPALPPKKAKAEAAAGNAQPPESNEPVKSMNGAGAPAEAAPAAAEAGGGASDEQNVTMLNGLIGRFAQQQTSQTAVMGANKSKDPFAAAMKMQKKAATPLTSLDQLVTAGLIKQLPEPPAGKKFVLDVKTQKVHLQ